MISGMLSSLLIFSFLSSISSTDATPTSPSSRYADTRTTIPLTRRAIQSRTDIEWSEWAKTHRDRLTTKYGGRIIAKRASGTNLMVNHFADSSYYGSIAIGTPAVSYNVILDTGSADLWVADSDCRTGCTNIDTFDTTSSSTFVDRGTAFSITYGSGATAGTLGEDVIQMAGFSVSNQTFAVCDQVTSGLLDSPVSGLMGLSFQGLSSSGASPFWETLVSSGAWDNPLMAFQLTRFNNYSRATSQEYGGSFTMGFTDSSLYTGGITYTDVTQTNGLRYWSLPIAGITIDGSSVQITSGTTSYAVIDTGTTLIGGPASDIAAIYAQIPGSAPGTGNYEGYYTFPCSTAVTVAFTFGTQTWAMSADDFSYTQTSSSTCLGAFFSIDMGSSGAGWIIGDAFLKNVYSVFRYDPPSVGFAALASAALALNGGTYAAPEPTIGSVAASATGGTYASANFASSLHSTGLLLSLVVCATVAFANAI